MEIRDHQKPRLQGDGQRKESDLKGHSSRSLEGHGDQVARSSRHKE